MASWSSLTDDMFEDEMETRNEAFASYMRWKRGQAQRSRRWIPGVILDYFGNGSDDFERPQRDGTGVAVADTSSGAQSSGTTPMEVEEAEEEISSEPESQKRRRYEHLDLSEASDTELWMQIHHHDVMDVDEDMHNEQPTNANPPGFEVQLQDVITARESARRIYEQRRLQALECGDFDALQALERNYECVNYV